MKLNVLISLLFMLVFSKALAWEPSQAYAKKISLEYELFPPFGNTQINMKVNGDGYIELLSISTGGRSIIIPANELQEFRYPSLPDVEIMHYGEKDAESGLGGTFSLCVPYGRIKRVENEKYWQRPVLAVFITPSEERIRDVPLPKNNTYYSEFNGCEISAQEVYGF
ncbi:hypothetical protein [Microbulbifer sp. JTAC008]|uniref:hypothetical protein n=1 Tax=unclassified Microbulbifer TaxID=2619833 RepID=UPI004039B628